MTPVWRIPARLLLALLAASLLATAGEAHSHKRKNLEIVHPWCIETDDVSQPVAVFMTIRNTGSQPDRLLSATTEIAEKVELHSAAAEPNAPVGLGVASGRTELARKSTHIRLSGVKKPLGAYDSFHMTLTFQRAGKIEVEVVVEEAAMLAPEKAASRPGTNLTP
jgi:periplasmic copper chaperone A